MTLNGAPLQVRPATLADLDFLVESNCRLAEESEHKRLDPAVVTPGVRAVLDDAAKGRYFVAVAGTQLVGQVLYTWEWSDWRNGTFWWLQSVYVIPEARGRGVFRALFEHLRAAARADPQVVGLRLYVEEQNAPARETYRRLGFRPTGYLVLETPTV